MGLTSALYTGLSGMNTNQFRIDIIGDNIANANTTGFKGSRSMFQTQFAQMMSLGTPPGNNQGGSNAIEVGLGSMVGATQRSMVQGSTETTGVSTDMAIDGNGFFVVRSPSTQQAYTRDGSFVLNADNCLVTADGYYLQGYGVDANYNIIPGALQDMRVPIGQAMEARATDSATLSGNLTSNGEIGTHGSSAISQALVEDAAGTTATGSSMLTSLRSASDPSTTLFADGDVIDVTNVQKGGRVVPDAQFVVGTTGSTVDDFNTWLNQTLGIDTTVAVGTPGATIDSNGQLVINGNAGTANGLSISTGNIKCNGTSPFTIGDNGPDASANGQSVYTQFTAYDSLGTPIKVDLTMALESQSTNNSTWRFYAESPDNVGSNGRIVGGGTVSFDGHGNITAITGQDTLTIHRVGTGAVDPVSVKLDFSALSGLTTTKTPPSLVVTGQSGFDAGTLTSFSVGADGTVTGTFSNGRSRTLGRVALATFANPAGLTRQTNNVFLGGPNSGQPIITEPSTLGTGRIMSGALELSNVDLSREFIGLINASTGYSAAGKVITTSNQLLNDLLTLTR